MTDDDFDPEQLEAGRIAFADRCARLGCPWVVELQVSAEDGSGFHDGSGKHWASAEVGFTVEADALEYVATYYPPNVFTLDVDVRVRFATPSSFDA
jgi:hypothetical protein